MKKKKRSVIKGGMPVYKYISGGGEYYSSHRFLSSFKKWSLLIAFIVHAQIQFSEISLKKQHLNIDQ